jgi:hypothetical protein
MDRSGIQYVYISSIFCAFFDYLVTKICTLGHLLYYCNMEFLRSLPLLYICTVYCNVYILRTACFKGTISSDFFSFFHQKTSPGFDYNDEFAEKIEIQTVCVYAAHTNIFGSSLSKLRICSQFVLVQVVQIPTAHTFLK